MNSENALETRINANDELYLTNLNASVPELIHKHKMKPSRKKKISRIETKLNSNPMKPIVINN